MWPPSRSPTRSGALEVHRSPPRRSPSVVRRERLGARRRTPARPASMSIDRQAAAVDGDRVADRDAARAGCGAIRRRAPRPCLDRDDGAELLDDAGEHRLAQGSRSSPRTGYPAHPLGASDSQRRLGQRGRARPRTGRAAGAEHAIGASEQRHAVDQPASQKRRGQRRPALDAAAGDPRVAPSTASAVGERRGGRRGARPLERARSAGAPGATTPAPAPASDGARRAASRRGSRPRRSNTTRSGWRSAGGVDVARGQLGVVGERGADADQPPRPIAPAARARSARLCGDEIQRALARRGGGAAVAADRGLVGDVRAAQLTRACGTPRSGARAPRSIVAGGHVDLDPGRAQPREPRAVHPRSGSPAAHHDARHARRDQRIGAGRRAAVVRARLEADVHGRAGGRRAGRGQRVDLGVRVARAARASPRRRTSPSRTTTQPTIGLGAAVRAPVRRAPASARAVARRPRGRPRRAPRRRDAPAARGRRRRATARRRSPTPTTRMLAPAARSRRSWLGRRRRRPRPRPRRPSQRPHRGSRSSVAGMNVWPPQPGLTLMHSSVVGVARRPPRSPRPACAGFSVTPARHAELADRAAACGAGAGRPRRAR